MWSFIRYSSIFLVIVLMLNGCSQCTSQNEQDLQSPPESVAQPESAQEESISEPSAKEELPSEDPVENVDEGIPVDDEDEEMPEGVPMEDSD